jgi:putative transposase
MNAVDELASTSGTAAACRALNVPRASYYRRRRPEDLHVSDGPRRRSPRALTDRERQDVLSELHCERFVDKSPAEIHACLLDEGTYRCSVRTMYRILSQENEVRERRNQLRHPKYQKPELLATSPNQVWSWDITKLLGPRKWTYFYLYVILDIFSRYVVGWMLASRESAELAKRLIRETTEKEGVQKNELIIHSDRGPSMKSHGVAQLLATLGVTKSHSRPHVSNDNPFSESQFKTLKYRPDFPDRFGSQEHARSFCQDFFHWYNHEHYHSGIAMLTPATVHCGLADQVLGKRQQVLDAAYAAHPERFVNMPPTAAKQPDAVWINPPAAPDGPKHDKHGLVETTTPEEARAQKSELEISPLTHDLNITRPTDPIQIDHNLNKRVTQINVNRDEEPALTQEISTHQNGKRYTKFVTQLSQTR